jgi:hypothetical protein
MSEGALRAVLISPPKNSLSSEWRNKACRYCNRPLMEIDHYGEMLVGCIHCNLPTL